MSIEPERLMLSIYTYSQELQKANDIDQDRLYNEMIKSHPVLSSFLNNSPFLGYVYSFITLKYLYLSKEQISQLIGYPTEPFYTNAIEGGLNFTHEFFHPADWSIITEDCFYQVFEVVKKIPASQRDKIRFSYNWRMKRSDSTYGHFLQQFCIVSDEGDGKPILSVGAVSDITHLKNDNRIVFSADVFDPDLGFQGFKKEFWPEDAEKHILSKREIEVVRLLAEGLKLDQIADKLFISPFTVRAHKRKIFEKMQVHKVAELVARLTKEGVL